MGIWTLYNPKLPKWPIIGLPDLAGDQTQTQNTEGKTQQTKNTDINTNTQHALLQNPTPSAQCVSDNPDSVLSVVFVDFNLWVAEGTVIFSFSVK